jgi:tetratricopeptide (TPR) repeat protein
MRAMCLLLGMGLVCASVCEVEAQKKPPAAEPTDANRELAKKHNDLGMNHYNLGEFDEAITEFKAAYALTSEPGLLFNIAQSYRLKEDYKQALYFYKTYLRLVPDAANRADVERWIHELDRLLADQTKIKDSKPQGAITPGGTPPESTVPPAGGVRVKDTPDEATPPPAASVIETAPPPRGRSFKIAGLSTAGAGVLLIAAGAWMGSKAADDWDAINAYADTNGTWNGPYQDKWDEAERYDTLSTLTYVGGAAALVVGGTLYYLGMRDAAESRAEIGVAFAPGSARLTCAWGF